MSKIQDALDKIKKSTPVKSDVSQHNDVSISEVDEGLHHASIDDMYQPEVFTFEEKENKKLLDPAMHDRKLFNAFREIRTTLSEKIKDTSPIIMIASCGDTAGTSFVCANLAASIALDELRTSLLLDCNISKPSLDYLISSKKTKGLIDYLKNSEVTVEDIVMPTGIPRMRVIPVGVCASNLGEVFTSTRLSTLFAELKNKYKNRYIIVDAPSILENTDARIISQACDHIVLVVEYGRTSVKQLNSAIQVLGADKVLGVVINNEPRLPDILSSS